MCMQTGEQDNLGGKVTEATATEKAPQPTIAETEPILQFFAWGHLPLHLQIISQPFEGLAALVVAGCPRNPERTVALRKLLEAKDCAVRAALYK